MSFAVDLSVLYQTENAPDFKHEPMHPVFSQGCISARLDDLVNAGVLPVPDHIKIDVDGIEHKIIAGARGLLADRILFGH